MKNKGIVILSAVIMALAATIAMAGAREVQAWTFRELEKKADLIVVATPVATKDTDEKTILPHIGPDVQVVGLSSEFAVSVVLRGDSNLTKVVVHHYRLADPNQRMNNGPELAAFDLKAPTRHLLFLEREADGRYAPFDQVDPAANSLLKLEGAGWDNMKLDDFRKWLDAKMWLNERVGPGVALSPEISANGAGAGSLFEAALNGKLEKARALIDANPDLVFSHASYASQTPLHLAAEFGHKDVAELLLAHKADVEAKAYGGWTPLLQAVLGGHPELVELMLTNKAKVNYQEDAGRSPLHIAAENDYTKIAALLLANQADVNAKSRDGLTPLHIAVGHGNKDMAELFLANKAEVNAKDNSGRTPLAFAVLHDDKSMEGLLRQHGGRE